MLSGRETENENIWEKRQVKLSNFNVYKFFNTCFGNLSYTHLMIRLHVGSGFDNDVKVTFSIFRSNSGRGRVYAFLRLLF